MHWRHLTASHIHSDGWFFFFSFPLEWAVLFPLLSLRCVFLPPPPPFLSEASLVNSSRNILMPCCAAVGQCEGVLAVSLFREQSQAVSVRAPPCHNRSSLPFAIWAVHQGKIDVLNKVPSGLLVRTVVAHCTAIRESQWWPCPLGIRLNYL